MNYKSCNFDIERKLILTIINSKSDFQFHFNILRRCNFPEEIGLCEIGLQGCHGITYEI